METKPRSLTVAESVHGHPKITLTGAWLAQFGFAIGDQVSVTSIEPGTLLVKVETPADIMYAAKREKQLETQLLAAEAELTYHRKAQPSQNATQSQQPKCSQ